jgi:hypothetical protein
MTPSGRTRGVVCAALAAGAVVAVGRPWSPAAQPPPPPADTRPRVLGSAGCSATACHGGQPPASGVSSASAATLWFARDPHARAFDSLRTNTAREIARHLAAGNPPVPPDRDPRCLACHTNPQTVLTPAGRLDTSPAALTLRREGVGCESCHGAASKWIVPHATWSSPPARPAAYIQHDMAWINDLTVRAGVCAGCHVGAPATDRLPARDVTHDMIAAGHPPLAFELASYTATLPQHWHEIDRAQLPPKDRRGPEYPTRAWIAGQLVCGEFALRLLADNASRGPIWPELARFECHACHRPLGPDRSSGRAYPGRVGVDAWNVSYPLRRAAAADPVLGPALVAVTDRGVKSRAAVTADARAAADALAGWVNAVKTDRGLDARAQAVFAALKASPLPDPPDWTDAGQCVLALEARARGRLRVEVGFWRAVAFDRALVGPRADVRFTAGNLGPAHFVGERRRRAAVRLGELLRALP